MTRLSHEEKRDQWREARPAQRIEVHVSGAGTASVGGVTVVAEPGQEIQNAVLNHLHHLVLTTGRPVLASVHDDRIGYVVPLRMDPDGSSCCTGEPVRMTPRVGPAVAAGTVQAPTGVFGPPPIMDTTPPQVFTEPTEPAATPAPDLTPALALGLDPDPDPQHTPARGFDAVAEAVLGDGPVTSTEEGAALLTEPLTRINEAVKEGRIDSASALAERTITEASAVLGPDHPEVLRLRELAAYIAYLGGDPVHAFRLSLDVARLHRRSGDAEGAYGNVRSAATAWRAVRDPEQGLDLGRELIALWTELTTQAGPAATDLAPLDSAHARMGRLTERARAAASR
ncbi:hypothetical protein [Streptomyces sp. NPDC086787]|uniref:hypothetical protein n=1 Tax=Streptomyces sp. NPDC086787 TaxID=3365759 RepID=UPI00382A1352